MLTSWRPWRSNMVSLPDLAVLQRFKSSQPLAGTVHKGTQQGVVATYLKKMPCMAQSSVAITG